MRTPLSHPERRAAGFTLVELLLAVAIAVLIAALAWSLFFTASRSVTTQVERARGPALLENVLEHLRTDLTALFMPGDDAACELVLNPDEAGPFHLKFCIMRTAKQTPQLTWTEPRQLEYRVTADDDPAPGRLLRIDRTLSGPPEATTNVLLDHASAVTVSLHDGEAWRTAWPPAGNPAATPRAARIRLQERNDAALEAEFWLPAGHTATSRILRAAQPGAPAQ